MLAFLLLILVLALVFGAGTVLNVAMDVLLIALVAVLVLGLLGFLGFRSRSSSTL
jgi:hypothetical protein